MWIRLFDDVERATSNKPSPFSSRPTPTNGSSNVWATAHQVGSTCLNVSEVPQLRPLLVGEFHHYVVASAAVVSINASRGGSRRNTTRNIYTDLRSPPDEDRNFNAGDLG